MISDKRIPVEVRAIKEVCYANRIPLIDNREPKMEGLSGYYATFTWESIERNMLGRYTKIDYKTIQNLITRLAPTIKFVSLETDQLQDKYAIWVMIHTDKGIYTCKLMET